MGVLGGALGYNLLRRISPAGRGDGTSGGAAHERHSKLAFFFGDSIWDRIQGKVVLDFGCGDGKEVVEMATRGARQALGVEILADRVTATLERARRAGVSDRVHVLSALPRETTVDFVFSLDAFEHFSDPGAILRAIYDALIPGGTLLTSFGPTWYHPFGGHPFSVFPWSHLLFSETALIRWRSEWSHDGARRFGEIEGGLNQMTIGRFEALVATTPFELVRLEPVPIRKLRWMANRVTREFTSAVVRCELRKPLATSANGRTDR